jgi:hypothetical protein
LLLLLLLLLVSMWCSIEKMARQFGIVRHAAAAVYWLLLWRCSHLQHAAAAAAVAFMHMWNLGEKMAHQFDIVPLPRHAAAAADCCFGIVPIFNLLLLLLLLSSMWYPGRSCVILV